MLRWLTLAFTVVIAAPVTAAGGDHASSGGRDAGAAHRSAAVSHATPDARLAHRRGAGNSGDAEGGGTPPLHLLQPRAQPGNAAGNSLRDPGGGTSGGWYQRGFGGTRDPGWGYGFGPTLGSFGH